MKKYLILFVVLSGCASVERGVEYVRDRHAVSDPILIATGEVIEDVSVTRASALLEGPSPVACSVRLESGMVITYADQGGSSLLPVNKNSRHLVKQCAMLKKGDVVDVVEQRAWGVVWTLLKHHKHRPGIRR